MLTNKNIDKIEIDEVLLNGTVVAKGAVSVELKSRIEFDEFGKENQIITIDGVMQTGYYIPDLETIETRRYYIQGVSVQEEHYGSSENKIVYVFQASLFQVKFQDERDQYYRVEKDEE